MGNNELLRKSLSSKEKALITISTLFRSGIINKNVYDDLYLYITDIPLTFDQIFDWAEKYVSPFELSLEDGNGQKKTITISLNQ